MTAEKYTATYTPQAEPVAVIRTNRFAVTVANARLAIPISQSALADAVGVTKSAINNWERAYNCPTLLLAGRVAKLLSIPDDLRAFSPTRPQVFMRPDLRGVNPGTTGYAYPTVTKPAVTTDAEKRAVHRFRRIVVAAARAMGEDADTLVIRAGVPPRYVSSFLDTGTRRVPMLLAARLADYLGLSVALAAFAEADMRPLPPAESSLN